MNPAIFQYLWTLKFEITQCSCQEILLFFFFFLFSFSGRLHSICKFLGQGWNPSQILNPGIEPAPPQKQARCSIHCTTAGTPGNILLLWFFSQPFKNAETGVPIVAQRKRIWLASMRTQVRSLASLSGLRIWRCRELWCGSQTWLGSCVAVAVV